MRKSQVHEILLSDFVDEHVIIRQLNLVTVQDFFILNKTNFYNLNEIDFFEKINLFQSQYIIKNSYIGRSVSTDT